MGSGGQGVTCSKASWGACFSSIPPRSEFLVFITWFLPPLASLGRAGELEEHDLALGTSSPAPVFMNKQWEPCHAIQISSSSCRM